MRPAIRHRHDEPKRTPLPTAEARLSLLESLLVADESEAAQGAVSWVVAQGLARQAVCALVSEDSRLLTGAGGSGVPRSALEELSVELDERDHPLVKALWGVGPVQFPAGSRHPSLAITPPFVAIPLRPRSPSGSPLGLLLVSGEPAPELSWVAEVVAERIGLARIRARAAERRSARDRELLRAAIDAVPDPVLVTDREGAILFANPRARKLLLSSEPDGEERRRAVALNRMLLSVALAGREVEPSEPSRDELLLVDPAEGTDLLLELISVRLDQAAIVSVLRNVTDVGRATQELGESTRQLKAAQDEVAAERHRLELIIASVADPIVVTDSAGDVLMMNPPAERLFTVHPEGATEIQRRVRANDALFSSFLSNLLLMGDRMSWRGEVALADPPTGEPMPVEAVSGKILSSRGELSTVVTILHDRKEALERARLVEQLKTASAELEAKVRGATAELATQNELLRRQAVAVEQASAAKSQFLANISHEFRTPLNAILGYTSMLLQGVSGTLNPGQRKALARVDSNGRHLLQVINEILDITRIEAGRMPLNLSDFRLPELFREVIAELEPIMSRSPVPVVIEVRDDVPPVRGDRQKTKQIVVNLLSNALKFTHQGSIRIEARTLRGRRNIAIAVRDTGIGIAPEYHRMIFEDFKQVDNSPTRAYGGTGLGLAICRRLASMLGGRITLESALGMGSAFTLHIPRKAKR